MKAIHRKLTNHFIDTENQHELLFRHTFETQIHIQTQIRKKFILALATNDFLYLLLKYRIELSMTTLLTEKQVSRNPSFCRLFGAFLQNNDKLSKISKISEPIISESRDQYQRYSGTSIYTLFCIV